MRRRRTVRLARVAIAAAVGACALLLQMHQGAEAAPKDPAARRPGIVLLERGPHRDEEEALFEALRIYTRDLGVGVHRVPGAPKLATEEALAVVATVARAEAAGLAVWLADDEERPVLYALGTETRQLHLTFVGADDPDVAARTLALKIRALYRNTRAAPPPQWQAATPTASKTAIGDEGDLASPASVGPPRDDRAGEVGPGGASATAKAAEAVGAGKANGAVAAPAEEKSAPSPISAGATATAAAAVAAPTVEPPVPVAGAVSLTKAGANAPSPATGSTRPVRVEGTVGYGFDTSTDPTWLRHGLMLRLAAVPRRVPLGVEIDGAVTTRPGSDVAGAHVAVSDVPLGLGLTYRYQRDRFGLAVGPRGALHIYSAEGTSTDGRTGSTRRCSAGLGAILEARATLTEQLAIALTVSGEALVPRQTFTTDGVPAIDLGIVQFGAQVGLVIRLY